MIVGYKRVSSLLQNTSRQLVGINNIDRIFEDKASGKNIDDRTQLKQMIAFVRDGDTIIVHSMDRLARNLTDLLTLVKQITNKGVTIQFIKENLTFSNSEQHSSINKLLLAIIGSIAEFERELILERQKEGIAQAKLRGVYKGRKPVSRTKIDEVINLIHTDHLSVKNACIKVGICPATYYKYKHPKNWPNCITIVPRPFKQRTTNL